MGGFFFVFDWNSCDSGYLGEQCETHYDDIVKKQDSKCKWGMRSNSGDDLFLS